VPELPEVETVVRYLRPWLVGKTIQHFQVLNGWSKVIQGDSPETFTRNVVGQKITRVHRRGKFIVWNLTEGNVFIHLRMTGRLITNLVERDNPKHLTAEFQFSDGSNLYFKDYRKFGRISFSENPADLETKLGPEPLSPSFTAIWFYNALQAHRRQIKPLLLDQTFLAGLGNIYVDESLWRARIHPLTVSYRVSKPKAAALATAIQTILKRAIELNGTTIQSFSFGQGETGRFVSELQVFGRAGKPCPRCNTPIRKIRVAQRGTHFCPRCQRPRR
jgi:formamidopyrimidine-DNA glycosylase